MKTPLVTREGYEKLKQELNYLWREERPEVTKKVTWAASLGDRSENADYQYNKKRLREIDRRVRYLTKCMENLKIVDYSPQQEGKVFFGAWVEIENDDGVTHRFRIVGLEIGADDYIPKPFNPRELLARIRAVLRRQANELPGAPSQEEAVIAFGKFKLNLGTREMFREDEPMPLTSGEFAVLKALVSHPREPLSRDKLMNLARGREYSAMERSIDVQISRLRRMVEEDPAHPRYIQTVWGLGYVFVPDGSKA